MIGRAIVCTHHKAGTVWMDSTFRALARALGVPFINLRTAKQKPLPPGPAILFDPETRWYEIGQEHPSDRVFHLIRDPRDMVISGMHYHRRADEPWLHKPRKTFGGKSYQQTLNALPDDRSRLLFEMERTGGSSLQTMLDWDYGRPECFECRYEQLITDADASLFASACRHLGVPDEKIDTAKRYFLKHALFGVEAKRPEHVRDGTAGQWRRVFDRSLAEAFDRRHGDALIALGYETDHRWVKLCGQNSVDSAAPSEADPPAL